MRRRKKCFKRSTIKTRLLQLDFYHCIDLLVGRSYDIANSRMITFAITMLEFRQKRSNESRIIFVQSHVEYQNHLMHSNTIHFGTDHSWK